jgi:magnesium transporter
MIGQLLRPEIREMIERKEWNILKEFVLDLHPSEIADIIENIEEKDRAILFRFLPNELAADTFEYLEHDVQEALLKSFTDKEIAEVLNEMSPDDRTELLEELPGPFVKKLLRLLTPEERSIAISLLGYPEDSVGRLMTPDFIAIKSNWTIAEVLEHIRKVGSQVEYIETLFVTDQQGKLLDEISIKDILLAEPSSRVTDIMKETVVSLQVTDDQEKAVELFREYDVYVLPVVNKENYLVGIVTADDVFDVIEEETTEDVQKFGGMESLDLPYISTPLPKMVQKRAGWLVILFLSEMLTATAMGFFENEIARAVVLALFIPLIISSGGNSGSQAATLVIRALALGEITVKDWFRVVRREFFSGLSLGAILGAIGFLRISVWQYIGNVYGEHWFSIAITVAIALIGVVLWGTLAGSTLPLILKSLKLDPATSSAPFVATLVDVTGLVIYFSVATLILSGTLL